MGLNPFPLEEVFEEAPDVIFIGPPSAWPGRRSGFLSQTEVLGPRDLKNRILQVRICPHAKSQVCRWSVAPGSEPPEFGVRRNQKRPLGTF